MRIKMGLMALAFTAMGYGCDDGDTAGTGTIGAQCEGGGDCASAICLTAPGAAAGYCSDECSAEAPCPGNFECTTVGAQNICVQTGGNGQGGNGGNAAGGNGGNAAGGTGGNAAGGNGGEGGSPMGGNGGEGGMPMGGDGGNGGMPMGGDGGNGGMPPAGLDCPGIVDCFVECGQDRDCQTSCVERGTAEDQELFLNYLTCVQNSGGDQEACVDEQTACVGAPPSGDGECPDFYECANRCPDGEAGQQCVQDCFGGLAPDAQNQVLDIVNCVQAVQAENPNATNEDINEACAAEIEVCFGPPPPPGDTNCGPMLDCVIMAGADQEAGQACIAEGTLQARELFNEFAGCFNENMCMQIDCPACADELAACQNDMGGGMGGMGGGMGGEGGMGEGGMGGEPMGEGGMGEGGMGGEPAPEGGAGGAPE